MASSVDLSILTEVHKTSVFRLHLLIYQYWQKYTKHLFSDFICWSINTDRSTQNICFQTSSVDLSILTEVHKTSVIRLHLLIYQYWQKYTKHLFSDFICWSINTDRSTQNICFQTSSVDLSILTEVHKTSVFRLHLLIYQYWQKYTKHLFSDFICWSINTDRSTQNISFLASYCWSINIYRSTQNICYQTSSVNLSIFTEVHKTSVIRLHLLIYQYLQKYTKHLFSGFILLIYQYLCSRSTGQPPTWVPQGATTAVHSLASEEQKKAGWWRNRHLCHTGQNYSWHHRTTCKKITCAR